MGCSSTKVLEDNIEKNKPIKEEPKFDFFKAYKSFKKNIILYKKNEKRSVSFKAYLISTNTIPNFLELIEKTNILNYIYLNYNKMDNPNNEIINKLEDKLKELLNKYELDNNIEIYHNYNKCINLKNLNIKENEFIMVGDEFIDNMNANPDKKTGMEIIVDIDEDDDDDDPGLERKIKFLNNKSIGFKEKKLGFYKFVDCIKEKTIENNNIDQFNPENVIITKENQRE